MSEIRTIVYVKNTMLSDFQSIIQNTELKVKDSILGQQDQKVFFVNGTEEELNKIRSIDGVNVHEDVPIKWIHD